jgi:competence/damage-inducible protein cinA
MELCRRRPRPRWPKAPGGALGVDWACSVTGVAGPGGGSEEKPVGLVYLGVAGPGGTTTHRQLFPGIRESVRARSVQMALVFLRDALLRDR